MSCDCALEAKNQGERRTLWWLLGINAVMFVAELSVGIIAESTALIADSLDMFADASVYGISLYVVGKDLALKARAAVVSGVVEVALALGVLLEVARRLWFGSEPESLLMIGMGVVALAANVTCLRLLAGHRDGEVHMRASWIFSRNDVIVNLGVILSGGLVYALGSPIPDLVIGALIASVVLRGGLRILADARGELRRATN